MTGSLKVTFVEPSGNVRVIEDAAPGESVMEVGRQHDVAGILADCGGVCACATCHVYVAPEWLDRVGEAQGIETEMLDMVADVLEPTSRLSCQITLSEALDGLKVTVAPTP